MTLKEIQRAGLWLKGVIYPTPLIPAKSLVARKDVQVYLKLENLQKTGSFKLRGAYNKLSHLSPEQRKGGVIAASAGNHAQGVAYAASLYAVPAVIVMPERSALIKISATRAYGAEVILRGANFDEACSYAQQLAEERKLTFIPAFDDEEVIAGQGTIALEILRDLPEVTTVIVPVGGGGLISGIAIGLKETRPGIKVIGVEARGAAAIYNSLQAHAIRELSGVKTIADGIAIKKPGRLTFPLIQHYVDEMVLVEEEEIAGAILALMEREKLLAEGAGAVSLAALMEEKVPVAGEKVVLIISGGNIDVNTLARIIEKGLVKSGRLLRIRLELEDIPGALNRITSIVAEQQANILHIIHDRLSKRLPIGITKLELDLETRGDGHGEEIMAALEAHGYFPRRIQ